MPHFIFVVWSALAVSGWVVVAWSRKSYLGPAETNHYELLTTSHNTRLSRNIPLFHFKHDLFSKLIFFFCNN